MPRGQTELRESIAAAVDAGALGAAQAAIAKMDPLRRRATRERLALEYAGAANHTTLNDEAHILRLAYLSVIDEYAPAPDDLRAVEALYVTHRAGLPPHIPKWRASLVALVATLVLGAASAAGYLLMPRAYQGLNLDPEVAPMAYTTGGRPDPSTAEVRAFFEHELPGFMIAMARGEDGQESARRVLASARSAQLPDAVVGALQGYTGAYVAALGSDEARPSAPSAAERAEAGAPVLAGSPDAAGSPDTPDTPGSTQAAAVQAASAALNRSLASAQLGYYVDSQVTRHREHGLRVYLETFEVKQVAHYRLGPHVERALTIKRLDHSNIALSTLGFTRPEATEGLVQIDRIEEHLLAHVLPALQPDGVFRYAPASATRTPAMTQLEELASASIRGELLALVPAEAGMALAGAIHTRRALFERWQEAARRQDAVFRLPTTYEIDMESLEPYRWQLEGFSELRRVHRVLGEDATVHAYITLRDALVRSVTRHELQHRYDYREGIFDQVPAGLAEALLHQPAGEPLEGVPRATVAELSAYCAAIAEGGDATKTELALLSRHLLGVGMGRPAEARAAGFLLEQLDALLFPDGPIIGRRSIHSATRVQRILGRDAAEIRAGARQLWERWFGRPLPRWEPSATPPP